MAANERFFWPLGLALAWTSDKDDPTVPAIDLHIREWKWTDGHHERIELEADDAIGTERRGRFAEWFDARLSTMPPIEAEAALRESSSDP